MKTFQFHLQSKLPGGQWQPLGHLLAGLPKGSQFHVQGLQEPPLPKVVSAPKPPAVKLAPAPQVFRPAPVSPREPALPEPKLPSLKAELPQPELPPLAGPKQRLRPPRGSR